MRRTTVVIVVAVAAGALAGALVGRFAGNLRTAVAVGALAGLSLAFALIGPAATPAEQARIGGQAVRAADHRRRH